MFSDVTRTFVFERVYPTFSLAITLIKAQEADLAAELMASTITEVATR